MSWIILYRNVKTDKVHPVVTSDAYGILEFDVMTEAIDHLEAMGLPEDTPTQIVETDEL